MNSEASTKEEVISKQTMDGVGSSLKLKNTSSAKDLAKYQEQLKLHQKLSQSLLVEASKSHTEGTKLVAADKDRAPAIKHGNESVFVKMETDLAPSVVQPPDKNVDLGVTVKKELLSTSSGTPTPTDMESILPKFMTSSDEKPLSPMQTPHPSTGLPLSTDIHIIVQQRNKAVDNLMASRESRPSSLATVSGTQVYLASPNKAPMQSTTAGSASPSVPDIYTMQSPVFSTTTRSLSPSISEKVPTIYAMQSSVASTSVSPSVSVPSTGLISHTQTPTGPPLPSLAVSNPALVNPPLVLSSTITSSKPSTTVVSMSETSKPTQPLPSPPTTKTVSPLLQAADQKDNTQNAVPTSVQVSRSTYGVSVTAYTSQSPAKNVLQTLFSSPGQGSMRATYDVPSQPQVKVVTQHSPVVLTAPSVQAVKSVVPTPAAGPPPLPATFKPAPPFIRSQLSTTQPSTPPTTIHSQPSLSPPFASKLPSPLVIASQSKLEPTQSSSETNKHKDTNVEEQPPANVGKFELPTSQVDSEMNTAVVAAQSVISESKNAATKDVLSVSKPTVLEEAKIVISPSTPTKLEVGTSNSSESRKSEVFQTRGSLEGTQQLTKEMKEPEQTNRTIATTSELGKRRSLRSPSLGSSDMKGGEKTTPVKMESGLKQVRCIITTCVCTYKWYRRFMKPVIEFAPVYH